jgi:hypothetical protein
MYAGNDLYLCLLSVALIAGVGSVQRAMVDDSHRMVCGKHVVICRFRIALEGSFFKN